MRPPLDPQTIILSLLALSSWCALAYNLLALLGVLGAPSPGDFGMTRVFNWLLSFVFVALTWLTLAALYLRTWLQGLLQSASPKLVAAVFLFSAAAAVASIFAVSTQIQPWPVAVPLLLPLLLAGYLAALRSPTSHRATRAVVLGAGAGGGAGTGSCQSAR